MLLCGLQAPNDGQEVLTDGACFGYGVFKRDVGDGGALENNETAKVAGVDKVDSGDAVPRREHAVVGGWGPAALSVAEVNGAGFVASAFLDLLGEDLADAGEADVAKGVELGADGGLPGLFWQLCTFGDDDEGEALAALPACAQETDDVVDVDREFGDEGNVSAAGDADGDGDPAGVTAHDFHDLHARVCFGSGMEAVDGFGGDGDGGVEAEAGVGAAKIVVDGLGNADAVDAALRELDGDGLGVVATKGDEGVELVALNDLEAGLEAAFNLLHVGARRAEDGATAMEDAAGGLEVEGHGAIVDDAAPAFKEADELVVVVQDALANDSSNDGVQAGTVSAASQHSNAHF